MSERNRAATTRLSLFTAAVVIGLVVASPAGPHARSAAAQPRTDGAVTFNEQVAPIIFSHCSSCHRPGESAPFSLLTYADARQRAGLIARVTETQVMPPWQPASAPGEFAGDRRLTPEQIRTLRRWAETGAEEGDPTRRPTPPAFPDGWRLGTPDIVVSMAEAFTVPSGGADVFRNFVLPVPLTGRRYVRAFEFRPGNPRVLHHARILLDDTGETRRLDANDPGPGFSGMDAPGARFPDGHFLGWAPGRDPSRETYQWPIEPGTELVVQMHLTPSGRPEDVRASIGLYLTDEPPPAVPLMLRLGSKTIDIPAGAEAYEVRDSYRLPADVSVLSIYPHAHYLATAMTVEAERPDGSIERLLHIPSWNFKWQDEYVYSRPATLPRGTMVRMRYVYDNSAGNPHNPSSPPKRVRFGSDTSDEMGELLLQVLPSSAADLAQLRADAGRQNLLADIAGEEKRIADVPGDYETRNALGVGYVQIGRVADAVNQFEHALQLAPDHAVTHYNLGVIAMGERRLADGVRSFERALAARPDYVEAHNNLGVALESIGRAPEALEHYRAALTLRPSHLAARNNLGRVLLASGQVPEALAEFRVALRKQPDNPDVLYNFGRALVAGGDAAGAAEQWNRALAARPDAVPVLTEFARLLTSQPVLGAPGQAAEMAERAIVLTGGTNPTVLDVAAAAYAAAGQIDMAIAHAQTALQRATAAGNERLVDEIGQRLAGYEDLRRSARPAGDPGIP